MARPSLAAGPVTRPRSGLPPASMRSICRTGRPDCRQPNPYPSRPFVAAVAFLGAVLVSACNTTGPRDASGNVMQLTSWHNVDASDSDLNIPALVDVAITDVQKQIRDNQVIHNKMTLGGDRGTIATQRVSGAWYGFAVEKSIKDADEFRKFADGFFGAQEKTLVETRKIQHRLIRAGGFAAVYAVGPTAARCFVARAGYRLGEKSGYDNDQMHYDAVMDIMYCDPTGDVTRFDKLLGNVAIVTDRKSFRAALQAIPAAVGSGAARSPSAAAATAIPVSAVQTSQGRGRWIAFDWETYSRLEGTIDVKDAEREGTVSVRLPGAPTSCVGRYTFEDKQSGTWTLACPNRIAATGTFRDDRSGNLSAEGRDTLGRAVRFAVSDAR